MGTKITQEKLEDMAKFFLKEYFYDIPYIPCYFVRAEDMGPTEKGRFVLEENDDYRHDRDELTRAPEYRWQSGRKYIPSWTDALNKPGMRILLSSKLIDSPLKLTAILLHELAHYYCWYSGYDYNDSSSGFDSFLKQLGLPSNYRNRKYDKEKKVWIDTFDYNTIRPYCRKYQSASNS